MKKLVTLKDLAASKKIIFIAIAGVAFVFIIARSIMETYDNEVKKLKEKQNINQEKKVDIKDRAVFDIDQTTALKNKIEEVRKDLENKIVESQNKNEELNKQIEDNQIKIKEQQEELIALKSLNSKEEKIAEKKILEDLDSVKEGLSEAKKEFEKLKREKEVGDKIDIKLPKLEGSLADVIKPVVQEQNKVIENEVKIQTMKEVPEKGFFKFSREDGKQVQTTTTDEKEGEEEKKFESRKMDLMMGLVDAIMVTGVDAPTNIGTKNSDAKDPLPVLLSVNSETIIANSHVQEYKDCFILGTATGNATTERAYIRLSKLSCVAKGGETRIETDIEGWVYGEDNKVGVSGHLVTKSGSLILKGLMAGILQGIADSTSNTDNYFNGGNGGYYNNNNTGFGESAAQGMGSGVGSAFKTLADFYIDMAKDLYPVIEVKGGREVQILVKGGKQITESPYNKLFVNTDYEMILNKNISIDY
ncbi:TrbI/VirB10 family protein [Aliarcobacter butzleri]|uniref:TrbI/VirB10 family protein n=1 Tax=Aliarcobacter butzleri TaxID=28197 RepID=UPI0021B6C2DB|nr:TrbI/VirB10 family protein [Aliarcobacter butzleri]MCT7578640.1 hypothetical protein [Aliarcobacter butzleri]